MKEIHTEVYAYGYLFTFAQGDGIRITEVSPHWLYKTTNGRFGEKSTKNDIFGKDFESSCFYDLIQKFELDELNGLARMTFTFELKIKLKRHTALNITPKISIGIKPGKHFNSIG